jgi:hypothetical protein
LSLVPPLLALTVFVIYLLQIRDQAFVRFLVANPLVYDDEARQILEGLPRTQPFFLSPLYPAFVALMYGLSGGSRLVLLAAQGGLLAVNVGLMGAVCARLLSRGVALTAMFIMTFYWSFYYFAGEVLPTTLCLTFLLTGVLLFAEKDRVGLHPAGSAALAFGILIAAVYALPALRNLGSLFQGRSLPAPPRAYWGALSMLLAVGPASVAAFLLFRRIQALRPHVNLLASGVVLGISMFVWSGVSIVAALFAASLLGGRRGRLIGLGAFVLGIALPIAGGLAHNYLVSGEITPVTASFGVNLFIGNNSSSDGMNPFKLGEGDAVRIEADKQ